MGVRLEASYKSPMPTLPDTIRTDLDLVFADERPSQSEAFTRLMATTEADVPWAGLVWDELAAGLASRSNRIRAIAGQLLCRLAVSAPDLARRDIDLILAVTYDERFVTARHVIQSLWRIGLANEDLRAVLLARLEDRFHLAAAEKNRTLLRYDLLVGLKQLSEATNAPAIPPLARKLVAIEPNEAYRKKYRTVWKA